MSVSFRPRRAFVIAADLSDRYRAPAIVCSLLVATIFVTQGDSLALAIFQFVLLPLSGLSLAYKKPTGFRFSLIFLGCVCYLIFMLIATIINLDDLSREIWKQLYRSIYISIFILVVSGCISSHVSFVYFLFISSGLAAAFSALFNIYYFMKSIDDALPTGFLCCRMTTVLGMPAYANSTNISATYAVFFVGIFATAVTARIGLSLRIFLLCLAAVLLLAIVATQSRSGLVAAAVGAASLIVTFRPQIRTILFAVALLAAMLVFWIPPIRELILSRGLSYRPEVWRLFLDLIAERPFLGYGSLSPVGVTISIGSFLDQAHNLVLSAWFRGGLASAAAMTIILVGGLYWTWRYWVACRQIVPLCVMATITAAGMFDYQLMITDPTWPWVTFWLPFALAVGAEVSVRARYVNGVQS